tara:strand:+ start:970 stop:2046 length:1077 start_codon:yes stop_codon:yes gene_type:complete
MSSSTKKKRSLLTKEQKQNLWNLFDQNNINNNENKKIKEDEFKCIYNAVEISNKCELCNWDIALSDDGFNVCTNKVCAVVYTDSLDLSPEWRYYGNEDNINPTRCGIPINPLLPNSSYGCKVLCDGAASYEMRKIRRITEWQAMPYKDRALHNEYTKITTSGLNAGIPKMIINEACKYHQMISEKKTFRGLNRSGIIAASLYIACRIEKYPRTAKEISRIFNLDVSSATKGCKNAMTIINEIEQESGKNNPSVYSSTDPNAFIERFCSKLHINQELTKLCLFVAFQLDKLNYIPENTPHSVAAGIVYFISYIFELGLTKKDVQLVSDISEVTINKCYKKLLLISNKLIPPKLKAKYVQ